METRECDYCGGDGYFRDERALRINRSSKPDNWNSDDYYDTECHKCNGTGRLDADS